MCYWFDKNAKWVRSGLVNSTPPYFIACPIPSLLVDGWPHLIYSEPRENSAIFTTYPPQSDKCGHVTYYVPFCLFDQVGNFYWPSTYLFLSTYLLNAPQVMNKFWNNFKYCTRNIKFEMWFHKNKQTKNKVCNVTS